MKTTIDLSDDLALRAKRYAARHGLTLRAVVEEGIRLRLRADRGRGAFRLREAGVGGDGLRPEFRDGDWAKLRESAYAGRGG